MKIYKMVASDGARVAKVESRDSRCNGARWGPSGVPFGDKALMRRGMRLDLLQFGYADFVVGSWWFKAKFRGLPGVWSLA